MLQLLPRSSGGRCEGLRTHQDSSGPRSFHDGPSWQRAWGKSLQSTEACAEQGQLHKGRKYIQYMLKKEVSR